VARLIPWIFMRFRMLGSIGLLVAMQATTIGVGSFWRDGAQLATNQSVASTRAAPYGDYWRDSSAAGVNAPSAARPAAQDEDSLGLRHRVRVTPSGTPQAAAPVAQPSSSTSTSPATRVASLSGRVPKAAPASTVPGTQVPASSSAAPCNPSGQTAPVGNLPGWRQTFSDNFSGNRLDTSKWIAYWGRPGGDTAGWWDPSHVVVSGCMATLRNYVDPATRPGVYTTGGIGTYCCSQPYGKWLIRMRADKGDGIGLAALLWPKANVWPPEIDFYEDSGGARTSTSATVHYGPSGNDCCWTQKTLANNDFSQWHTVGVEWTPGQLTYTIDGTVWASVSNPSLPSIPMWLSIQTRPLGCAPWNTCINSSTPREVDANIAWVVGYAPA
jgi:beta-glucanase (GH16 family)